MKLKTIFIILFSFFANLQALAGSKQLLTVEGTVFDSTGTTPVVHTDVVFKAQIVAPNGCVLWDENLSAMDLSLSKGGFVISVGGGANTASGALTWDQIFKNGVNFTSLTGTACPGTYNGGLNDDRTLYLTFSATTPSTILAQQVPPIPIKANAQNAMIAGIPFFGTPGLNEFMKFDGSKWISAPAGLSNVTLNFSPAIFSPINITADGSYTFTASSQLANTFFAGPAGASGAPSFRTLNPADIVAAVAPGTNGNVLTSNGSTWLSSPPAASGMANPMTILGDVIYGGAAGAPTRLAGNSTTTRQFLTQTGTGGASAAPAWGTLTATDIPSHDASKIISGLSPNRILIANGTGTAITSDSCGSGQILQYSGTNWNCVAMPVGGTPGGASTQIQFNNTGAFAGSANFVWDNSNSRLGIGTSTPASPLEIKNLAPTDIGGSMFVIANISGDVNSTNKTTMLNVRAKPTVAGAQQFAAVHAEVDYSAGTPTTTGVALMGDISLTGTQQAQSAQAINASIDQGSSTVLPTANAIMANIQTQTAKSITTAKGLDINIGGAGTITNAYGLYINNMTATNKWAIYSNDPSAPSFFAGNVGIGVPSPVYKVDVAGDVNVTGAFRVNGIPIGGGGISGTGTTNKIPKFTSATTLGDSVISDLGAAGIDVAGGYYANSFQVLTGSGFATHKAWIPNSMGTPGLSAASQGSIYFDSMNKFLVSENGGAYVKLIPDAASPSPLITGGTGASLTPLNGAVAYSTASNIAFTTAPGTSGRPLLSTVLGAPTWSTIDMSGGNIIFPAAATLSTPTAADLSLSPGTTGKIVIGGSTPTVTTSAGNLIVAANAGSQTIIGQNVTSSITTIRAGSTTGAINLNAAGTGGINLVATGTAPISLSSASGNITISSTTGIINTTTPINSTDGSAGNPAYTFFSGSGNGMFYPGGNSLAFSTNGTERMRIDNLGNVTTNGTLKVGTAITGGTPVANMKICDSGATINFGISLTAGQSNQNTFMCTGVQPGMAINCSPAGIIGTQAMVWSAFSHATDTIKIVVMNNNSGPSSLTSQTWKCIVMN